LTFISPCIILIGKIGKEAKTSMAILNIKDFPDDLHRKAKAEAALTGISLKAFIIKALEEFLKKKKRG
jgi:predicted HicB family RNase H-like nuclease